MDDDAVTELGANHRPRHGAVIRPRGRLEARHDFDVLDARLELDLEHVGIGVQILRNRHRELVGPARGLAHVARSLRHRGVGRALAAREQGERRHTGPQRSRVCSQLHISTRKKGKRPSYCGAPARKAIGRNTSGGPRSERDAVDSSAKGGGRDGEGNQARARDGHLPCTARCGARGSRQPHDLSRARQGVRVFSRRSPRRRHRLRVREIAARRERRPSAARARALLFAGLHRAARLVRHEARPRPRALARRSRKSSSRATG